MQLALARQAAAQAKPRRPLAYRLHGAFGLKLSVFLAFLCLTGSLAAVSHEIEWLLLPKVRATATASASTSAEPRSWGALWAAVRAARPEGWVRSVGSYDRSDAGYFAKAASVALPDGRNITVLVDRATARVTGEQHGVSFHSFMRGLHYYLFTPGDWGFFLVTAMSFVLLGSLGTGLIVYKRFWRGLWRLPRFGRDPRTWLGDLHRLSAVWCAGFVAVIAVTSIWYFVERTGVAWESPVPAAKPLRAQPDAPTVDRWVATAQTAMPGLRVTGVSLPWSDGEPVIVQGVWRGALVRERTDAAYIDPVSGALLGVRAAHRLGAKERWVHTADPLHFGNFAGAGVKLLWAIFGLATAGLILAGAAIHARRLHGGKARGLVRPLALSLGRWTWPTAGLIIGVPMLSYPGWDSGAGSRETSAGVVHFPSGSYALTTMPLDAQSGKCACGRSPGRHRPGSASEPAAAPCTTPTSTPDASAFLPRRPRGCRRTRSIEHYRGALTTSGPPRRL